MATLLSSIVESDPAFVSGTYDAKDVRNAAVGNVLPGLFASGDLAFSQRAAGANMSLDMAQGRVFYDPGGTHQGVYMGRRTSATAWNSSTDGAITVTAADASNPRIDLWCVAPFDTVEDASGVTGWKIACVVGTPGAGATHQLEVGSWPAIPTGYVPLAAVRVPALATTLTTANITNLNTIAGGRSEFLGITGSAETTTSSTYTRMTTPDFVCAYVPHSNARVQIAHKSQIKISVASGTQGATIFINGNQIKASSASAAPVVIDKTLTLGAFFSHLVTYNPLFQLSANSSDVSDVATGQIVGSDNTAGAPIEVFGLPAGWYVFEVRFKTSANTLSLQNRRTWVTVIA